MKFLIIVFIFAFLIMFWRKRQAEEAPPEKARPAPRAPSAKKSAGPRLMVACTHCGTHLPQEDAITGKRGIYCSTAHRMLRENKPGSQSSEP